MHGCRLEVERLQRGQSHATSSDFIEAQVEFLLGHRILACDARIDDVRLRPGDDRLGELDQGYARWRLLAIADARAKHADKHREKDECGGRSYGRTAGFPSSPQDGWLRRPFWMRR